MKYEGERTPAGDKAQYEAVPASPLAPSAGYRHIHGFCRRCKARKVSWSAGCPECHELLEDLSLHEPHEPTPVTTAAIPGALVTLNGPNDAPSDAGTYVRVFEAPSGEQTLVTIYNDGTVEVARRPWAGATWGPPEKLVSEESA